MNIRSTILVFCFLCKCVWVLNAQLSVYPSLPSDRNKSQKYSVRIAEIDENGSLLSEYLSTYTMQFLRSEASGANNTDILSDNHWTTFSFSPAAQSSLVKLEITMLEGSVSKIQLLPSTNVVSSEIVDGKAFLTLKSDKYVTAIINDDIKQPLFVFCDPKETNVPDPTASNVYNVSGTTLENPLRTDQIPTGKSIVYFGPGIHYIYSKTDPVSSNGGGLVLTDNNGNRMNGNTVSQIYIAGGAMVVGAIRAPKVSNLIVNGRGIIAGQVEDIPYCEQGNNYLTDRIYNSAITMADYNSKTNRNQFVDGITVILPLKYCIQVGAYATVRNTKCFAYHQTTDGIGAEANAKIYNNFIKTNDDMMKIYNDNMEVRNTYFWHQNNGACFQFGWNESQGKNCVIKNTYLLRDDAADSYMNESHWDNHSFINWHSTGYMSVKPVHENHIFDSINAVGMPPVKVWRFMAINMNAKYPAGSLGGILKNLQVKNVNLGSEKLASYIGATINGSTAEVNFTNVKLNDVCINKTNIVQDGNVTVTPTINKCFTPTSEPDAPSTLTASSTTYNSISLTWTDNSEIEEGFILETSRNGVDNWTEIYRNTTNAYKVLNLQPSTNYYFRVCAFNDIGKSTWFNAALQTNESPVVVPAAPGNLSVSDKTDKTVTLTWIDNATDEENFLIQLKQNGRWNTILTIDADKQSQTISELSPATEYVFRVLATNIAGNSLPSNEVTVITKDGFNSGILSNGSFESGIVFSDEGSWTLQPNYVTLSSQMPKTGLYSAKFQNPGGNYLEPEFNLKPLFTCYGAGNYNITMSVYVPASNTGTVELYFTPQNVYFQPKTERDKWVTITKTLTYATGAEIKLKAKTYNGPSAASFYVDDIAITTNNPKCTTRVDEIETTSFYIYPNPVSRFLNIVTNSPILIKEIRISSLNGQLEKIVTDFKANNNIDIQNLTSGMKILQLIDSNNNVKTMRFIINR